PLEKASHAYPFSFDRFLAETVAAVHKPHQAGLRTLVDLARPQLNDLLQELDRAAAQNLDDYEHLHQVRIIGKRLRYAMEVFAPCFAAPFRDTLYPAVEAMQEILGNANDSHVACLRLRNLRDQLLALRPEDWNRFRLAFEGLLRHHEKRQPHERQRFQEWWQQWQASGGEAAFAALLAVPEVSPQ